MDRVPNSEQLAVINELDGNLLVFASAGTGKTFTVANRVKNIIDKGRAEPGEILCLTFTTKACEEMTDDIKAYVGQQGDGVDIFTIHGFCYSFLRTEAMRASGKLGEIRLFDETDRQSEAEDIIKEWDNSGIPEKYNAGKLGGIISEFKHLRYYSNLYSGNEAADWRRTQTKFFGSGADRKCFGCCKPGSRDEALRNFFLNNGGAFMTEYTSRLAEKNCADYDDLVIGTALAMRDEEIRAGWRNKYKYITVDEMQDTSLVEYEAISGLFDGNNVMMCGDFFQTIYEWRGSKPEETIKRFTDETGAKIHMFRENYRSTCTLANASFNYLKSSFPELLGSYCPETLNIHSSEEGEPIDVRVFENENDETSFIYDTIAADPPADPSRLCIMARGRKTIEKLAAGFDGINRIVPEEKRLSFFTVERNQSFYKDAGVKDLLAFLGMLINEDDNASLERIATGYISRVGEGTLKKLRDGGTLGVSVSAYLRGDTYDHGDPYDSLIKASQNGSLVVFDTETTGLDLNHDQAIQIAAIRYNSDGEPAETFNEIVIPTVEISRGARDTVPFDVDKEISEHGIPAAEALERFSDFVRGCVIVGHNSMRYDSPLIARELKELGLPQLEIRSQFDTMDIAKQFYPGERNYKLATLCEDMNIINPEAHNALGDVIATGNVLRHMLRENIIPSREERKALLAKHTGKFESFYKYRKTLIELLDAEETDALVRKIVMECRVETHRSSEKSRFAVAEIVRQCGSAEIKYGRAFIRELLENASLSGSRTEGLIKKLSQIPIVTVHQSKGCEFDTVFIAGCSDISFPSISALRNGLEDEEKRLFYVAISRAKKKLYITASKYDCCGSFIGRPSRYLEKLGYDPDNL